MPTQGSPQCPSLGLRMMLVSPPQVPARGAHTRVEGRGLPHLQSGAAHPPPLPAQTAQNPLKRWGNRGPGRSRAPIFPLPPRGRARQDTQPPALCRLSELPSHQVATARTFRRSPPRQAREPGPGPDRAPPRGRAWGQRDLPPAGQVGRAKAGKRDRCRPGWGAKEARPQPRPRQACSARRTQSKPQLGAYKARSADCAGGPFPWPPGLCTRCPRAAPARLLLSCQPWALGEPGGRPPALRPGPPRTRTTQDTRRTLRDQCMSSAGYTLRKPASAPARPAGPRG